MPHIVAVVLAGAGLYAGYKLLSNETQRNKTQADSASAGQPTRRNNEPRDLGTLEFDPETQTYRPQTDHSKTGHRH